VAQPSALIVGAGIGGLAAGVALQRAGWRVRIFERAAQPRELGFGLLLASNALASLQGLGLADRVIAGGCTVQGGEIHGAGGRLLRRFDTAAVQHLVLHPPVVVLRSVLHGVLLDAVRPHSLSLNKAATGFVVHEGRPRLQLDGGDIADGDVLIGADGAASVIRRILHPDEAPPRRSGLWAIRGVAHDTKPELLETSGAQYFGDGTEGGIARASRSAIYWYVSVPEARLGESRDPRTIAEACAAEFDGRFRALIAATTADNMRLDELFDRDPISAWGQGPVTLLGDAAHPMLPHAGQGAAQALEDAVAVGRVLKGTNDISAALRRYEQARSARSARIVRLARRNARVISIANPVVQWLRDTGIRLVPSSLFARAYVEFGKPPQVD
jgi:2-polyprenyl-6-methoxyphenol hydroxylase-like FAD-dependent oxidoreductase